MSFAQPAKFFFNRTTSSRLRFPLKVIVTGVVQRPLIKDNVFCTLYDFVFQKIGGYSSRLKLFKVFVQKFFWVYRLR